MKRNHIFISVIGIILLSSHAYGLSPAEHKVAVYGCKQAIFDGAAKEFAKRSGHDPNNISLEENERVEARIKKELPELYDDIEELCNCTVGIIIEEEGGISTFNTETVVVKHMPRLKKECYGKSKFFKDIVGNPGEGNSQSNPTNNYKVEQPKKNRSLKPLKTYRD